MKPITFFILFVISCLIVLYFAYRKKINMFLFPDRFRYVLMRTNDEVLIWAEDIRNKYKFKFKEGIYYLDRPEKIKEHLEKELREKEEEVLADEI